MKQSYINEKTGIGYTLVGDVYLILYCRVAMNPRFMGAAILGIHQSTPQRFLYRSENAV